ncbi:MAG TPA: hypothetical protein VMG31_09775 [Verrucomicrobiae bacterium]|nr:hypothetical protein [Verrucomicrobiae bacterium]
MTKHQKVARATRSAGNEQARREMENFLRALDSYPARFVKEPHVTFDEHWRALMAETTARFTALG